MVWRCYGRDGRRAVGAWRLRLRLRLAARQAQSHHDGRHKVHMLERFRHELGEAGILFRSVARHARLQAQGPSCDSMRTGLGDRDSIAPQDTCLATRT